MLSLIAARTLTPFLNVITFYVTVGLFNSFLDQQDYKPKWTPIEPIIKGK